MELIHAGHNKWIYRDPQQNYFELTASCRKNQDRNFVLHCRLQSFLAKNNKKPEFLELHVRPLPQESLVCVASRPQSRRYNQKSFLVYNDTLDHTSRIVFYDQKNPQKNPVHDAFFEFGHNEVEKSEKPLLFELCLTVCNKRSLLQFIKGEDNLYMYEPVHIKLDFIHHS